MGEIAWGGRRSRRMTSHEYWKNLRTRCGFTPHTKCRPLKRTNPIFHGIGISEQSMERRGRGNPWCMPERPGIAFESYAGAFRQFGRDICICAAGRLHREFWRRPFKPEVNKGLSRGRITSNDFVLFDRNGHANFPEIVHREIVDPHDLPCDIDKNVGSASHPGGKRHRQTYGVTGLNIGLYKEINSACRDVARPARLLRRVFMGGSVDCHGQGQPVSMCFAQFDSLHIPSFPDANFGIRFFNCVYISRQRGIRKSTTIICEY